MVVTTIIGVMAAMSVPSFQRAIEQSRADIAVANLRAIWAAERLYWLEYHTYTTSVSTLQSSGSLDNGIPNDGVSSMGGYQYSVPPRPGAIDTTMTATATNVNGLAHTASMKPATSLDPITLWRSSDHPRIPMNLPADSP